MCGTETVSPFAQTFKVLATIYMAPHGDKACKYHNWRDIPV